MQRLDGCRRALCRAVLAAAAVFVYASPAQAEVNMCCLQWSAPGPIAFSPDGRHGYVADYLAILALKRDSDTGSLSLVEPYEPGGGTAIAVSPDGRHVYSAGQPSNVNGGQLRVWARDAKSGELSLLHQYNLKTGGADPRDMVVTPDGRSVYLSWLDGTIAIFRRNATSGRLSYAGLAHTGPGLSALVLSEDGDSLFTAAEGRVEVFSRNSDTGALELRDTEQTLGSEGLALDPQGDRVYQGPYGLSELSRDPDDGLKLIGPVGNWPISAWSNEGAGRLMIATSTAVYVLDDWESRLYQLRRTSTGLDVTRVYREFSDGARGLRNAHSITLSPDGRHLYVTAAPPRNSSFDAGSVSTFRRDPQTGDLRYVSIYRGPFFNGGSAPPSLTINHGAEYTNDPHVELTITPRGPFAFPFPLSNDGGFQSAVTVEPSPDGRYAWVLDSSGPERLAKTVYAQIFYEGDQLVITDDIVLDERPPEIRDVDVVVVGRHARRARFTAADDRSGVAALQVTSKRARGGRWRHYRSRARYSVAVGANWARVRDRAGNRSRWRRFVVRKALR